MRKRSRGPRFVLVVVATLVVSVGLPATADPPNIEDPIVDVFVAPNPCTGVFEQHTIIFTPFDHFHSNNVVIQDKDRHGFTESGYLLKNSLFHVVERADGVFAKLKDVWRNPETGDMFHAVGTFRLVGNAPVIDEFITLECITGPTLLP